MVTSSPVQRLTDKAKPWITKVIKEELAQEAYIVWELTVVAFPDTTSNDSLLDLGEDPSSIVSFPSLVLYLEIPGAEPGTSLFIAPILAPFLLNEQRVRKTVKKALQSMRANREKALAKLSEVS
jgi:hypothetical protein